MLPITDRSSYNSRNSSSDSHFPDYIRRLCDFKQMDFESAFDQIFNLLSLDPQKAYTSFYYRKRIYSLFTNIYP
jgi:hypothetical protein